MPELSYKCRTSLFRGEEVWTLTDAALESNAVTRLPFAEIASIRLHDVLGMQAYGQAAVPATKRCVITPLHGRKIILTSSHFLGLSRFEDRSASFEPFTSELLRRVAAINPSALLVAGLPGGFRWVWRAILLLYVVVIAFAAIIFVVAVWTKGWLSSDALTALPIFVFLSWSAIVTARFLRRGKTRRLDKAPRA